MRKITLFLIGLCFSLHSFLYASEWDGLFNVNIPDSEKCSNAPSYFASDFAFDAALLGGGAVLYGTSWFLRKTLPLPEYSPYTTYNKDDVPFIDRWAMRPYNSTLDAIGTVTCGIDFVVLPVTIFAAQTLIGNLPLDDLFTVIVMYAETALFTNAAKDFLKMVALRARPYMYFSDYDESAISNHDFEFSWPSGHTTNAFMGAAFVSYVFSKYYPSSKFKIPLIAASYSIAVGTGALRMSSGNHFFTDVLSGAVLGSVFGFGVPFVHHLIANSSINNSAGKANVSVSPLGLNIRLAL